MRFHFHGLETEADFEGWVDTVREDGGELDRSAYKQLAEPSQKEPVRYYADVDPGLYDAILNRCVDPGTVCMKDMMDHHEPDHDHGSHGN